MDVGFLDFCKANGAAGVLLVGLVLLWRALSPRIDKLINHFIEMNTASANVKPQLDRIEASQKDSCRFTSPGHVAP